VSGRKLVNVRDFESESAACKDGMRENSTILAVCRRNFHKKDYRIEAKCGGRAPILGAGLGSNSKPFLNLVVHREADSGLKR
jgi:hypothetical protein